MRVNSSLASVNYSNQTQKNDKSSRSTDAKSSERSPSSSTAALKLKDVPEVRSERVASAKQMVAAGDYFTQEAAEKTADAILKEWFGEPYFTEDAD